MYEDLWVHALRDVMDQNVYENGYVNPNDTNDTNQNVNNVNVPINIKLDIPKDFTNDISECHKSACKCDDLVGSPNKDLLDDIKNKIDSLSLESPTKRGDDGNETNSIIMKELRNYTEKLDEWVRNKPNEKDGDSEAILIVEEEKEKLKEKIRSLENEMNTNKERYERKVRILEDEIGTLKQNISESKNGTDIREYTKQLREMEQRSREEISKLSKKISELETTGGNKDNIDELERTRDELDRTRQELRDANRNLIDVTKQLKEEEKIRKEIESDLSGKESKLGELQKEIFEYNSRLQNIKRERERTIRQLRTKNNNMASSIIRVKELENQISEKNITIGKLERSLEDSKIKSPEEVIVLRDQIRILNDEIGKLGQRVDVMSPGDMNKLIKNLILKEKELENISGEIQTGENVSDLLRKINSLEYEKSRLEEEIIERGLENVFMESENSRLEAIVKERDDALKTMKGLLENMNNSHQTQNNSHDEEIKELEEKLRAQKEESDRKFTKLTEDISNTETELVDIEKMNRLKTELDAANSKKKELESKESELTKTISELRDKLETSDIQINDETGLKNAYMGETVQLKGQISTLNNQLTQEIQSRDAKIASLEAELVRLNEQMRQATVQFGEETSLKKQLESQITGLKNQLVQEIQSRDAKITYLETELAKLTEQMRQAIVQINDETGFKNAYMGETVQLKGQIAGLNSELNTLNPRVKELESELVEIVRVRDSTVKEKDDEIARMAREIETLTENMDTDDPTIAIEEISRLNGEIKRVTQEKNSEIGALNAQIDELNAKISELESTNKKMLDAGKQLELKIQDLEEKLSTATQQKAQIESELTASKTQINDESGLKNAYMEETIKLNKEKESLDAVIEGLRAELEIIKKTQKDGNEQILETFRTMNDEKNKLESTITDLNTEIEGLKNSLESGLGEKTQLEEQLGEANEAKSILEQTLAQNRSEISRLQELNRNNFQSYEDNLKALQQELSSSEAARESIINDLNQKNGTILDLTQKLTDAGLTNENLENLNNDLSLEKARLKENLQTFNQELEGLKKISSSYEKLLSQIGSLMGIENPNNEDTVKIFRNLVEQVKKLQEKSENDESSIKILEDTLQETIDKLTFKSAELEEMNKSFGGTIQEYTKLMDELRKQISDKETEIGKLQGEIDSIKNELNDIYLGEPSVFEKVKNLKMFRDQMRGIFGKDLNDEEIVNKAKSIKDTNDKLIEALNDFNIPPELQNLEPSKKLESINKAVKESILENGNLNEEKKKLLEEAKKMLEKNTTDIDTMEKLKIKLREAEETISTNGGNLVGAKQQIEELTNNLAIVNEKMENLQMFEQLTDDQREELKKRIDDMEKEKKRIENYNYQRNRVLDMKMNVSDKEREESAEENKKGIEKINEILEPSIREAKRKLSSGAFVKKFTDLMNKFDGKMPNDPGYIQYGPTEFFEKLNELYEKINDSFDDNGGHVLKEKPQYYRDSNRQWYWTLLYFHDQYNNWNSILQNAKNMSKFSEADIKINGVISTMTLLQIETRVSEYRQLYMRVMMSVTTGLMISSRGNVIEIIREKVKGLNVPGHLRWSPLNVVMKTGDDGPGNPGDDDTPIIGKRGRDDEENKRVSMRKLDNCDKELLKNYNVKHNGKKRPMSFYRDNLTRKQGDISIDFDSHKYEGGNKYLNGRMRENAGFVRFSGNPIEPSELFNTGQLRNDFYIKNASGVVNIKFKDTNIKSEFDRVVNNIEFQDQEEGYGYIDPAETRLNDTIMGSAYYLDNGGRERLVYLLVYLYGIHSMDKECNIITYKKPVDIGITGSSLLPDLSSLFMWFK